jgi:hypothetical protein
LATASGARGRLSPPGVAAPAAHARTMTTPREALGAARARRAGAPPARDVAVTGSVSRAENIACGL